jgi:hypothetical protein
MMMEVGEDFSLIKKRLQNEICRQEKTGNIFTMDTDEMCALLNYISSVNELEMIYTYLIYHAKVYHGQWSTILCMSPAHITAKLFVEMLKRDKNHVFIRFFDLLHHVKLNGEEESRQFWTSLLDFPHIYPHIWSHLPLIIEQTRDLAFVADLIVGMKSFNTNVSMSQMLQKYIGILHKLNKLNDPEEHEKFFNFIKTFTSQTTKVSHNSFKFEALAQALFFASCIVEKTENLNLYKEIQLWITNEMFITLEEWLTYKEKDACNNAERILCDTINANSKLKRVLRPFCDRITKYRDPSFHRMTSTQVDALKLILTHASATIENHEIFFCSPANFPANFPAGNFEILKPLTECKEIVSPTIGIIITRTDDDDNSLSSFELKMFDRPFTLRSKTKLTKEGEEEFHFILDNHAKSIIVELNGK